MSPLLANIALSALDEHFDAQWQREMSSWHQRDRRQRRGEGTWKLIRYADDFVLVVNGQRHHAEALRDTVTAVLAPLGLRLSPDKTRVVDVDEGFVFLGFLIQRRRKRGTNKPLRLHGAGTEGDPVHQGSGVGGDLQVNAQPGSGAAAAS